MDVCAWVRVYMGVEWMCVQVCFGECAGILGCVCRGVSANVQGCLGVCAGVLRRMCRGAWPCLSKMFYP